MRAVNGVSDRTRIDWCDATINPLGFGCYGPGGSAEDSRTCSYCYAQTFARRNMRGCPDCAAFRPHWHPEQLGKLAHWKKPRRVFIQSMGDLFGDWVPRWQIGNVLVACASNPQHTYLFLTTNPARLRGYREFSTNEWVGTSVINQLDADERIPLLLAAPAAHKFVSFEPMLAPVDLGRWLSCNPPAQISWCIIGAMTGPGAKPINPEWVYDLTEACLAAGIAVFHKDSLYALPTRVDGHFGLSWYWRRELS